MQEHKQKIEIVPEEQIDNIANLFSILSHPVRIKIIWLLKTNKKLSVHELQEKLKISQSSTSQHLGLLRTYRLVTEERDGKEVYYSIGASKKISKILAGAASLIAYQISENNELLSAYTQIASLLG